MEKSVAKFGGQELASGHSARVRHGVELGDFLRKARPAQYHHGVVPSLSICRQLPAPENGCLDVFDRELDYIFGTLLRLGARRSDIDDLLQDVFVALCASWPTLDTTRPLRPWLFGVAFRVVQTRRRQRARELPFESLDPPDTAADPEEQAQGGETVAFLRAALELVPVERSSVVMMHDVDGIDVVDIARQLSITKFGVYARLYKGRKELASAMRLLWKDGMRR